MKLRLGLKASLAVSFIALATLLLWLNHTTASNLRSYVAKQREDAKAKAVAQVIGPMLRHESEWVESVTRLLQHDLAATMRIKDRRRDAAVANLLDRTFAEARIDVLEVTDANGIVRHRAHEPHRKGDPATHWGVDEALAGNATLVSVRDKTGPLILYVAPILTDDKVVGTVSAGKRIDDAFITALSREIDADLVLVAPTGQPAASSKPWGAAPDVSAITEAFQHKSVAFRSSEGSRITQAYVPVFIVDEAWLVVAEIDSSLAYAAIDASNRKAAVVTIASTAAAIVLVLLLLRFNLLPLRRLREKAERQVGEVTGECHADAGRDDLESIVHSLNCLTDVLVDRNRLLAQQRAELKISASAFESQQPMAITDANLDVLTVNKAFTASTGFTREDLAGRTLESLRPELHGVATRKELVESILRSEDWSGEIPTRRKNGETYPVWLNVAAVRDDHGTATHFVVSKIDLTEDRRTEQRIRELAFFDPTTGLPNRRLLMDRLKQAIATSARNGRCGATLLIDVDDFKTLNNVLGHDNGDRLLRQIGQRLLSCVREAETVARAGGDEFVVLLGGMSGNPHEAASQAECVAARILDAFSTPFNIGDTDHHCTASIGIALFQGNGASVDDSLQQADLALYKAKDSGRNCLQFFDPDMQTGVMERAALEKDLRQAIDLNQMTLHYQAQVQGDGRICGAEVLIRWNHPERGMVSPASFIPLAEKTGLILPLGQWVLDTVCGKLAEWADRPELSGMTLAVNVSARQFHHPDFVDQVLAILAAKRADPEKLKLELTESLLVENVEEVIGKMEALRTRGITFSLDDFGTGYSSLSYLKRLPLEQLKIDQSFVRDILVDPNDAAIAATIVALAENLGLQVIAEGVETAEQRDALARSGCAAYQGYFFSRPLPVRDFEAYVRSHAASASVSATP